MITNEHYCISQVLYRKIMKFFCGDFLGRLVFSFSEFQLHLEHGKLSDSRAILRDSEWCQILSNSSIQPNMQNLHLLYHVIELNLKYLGYFAVSVPFYYRFLNTEKDGMLQQLSYSVMIQIRLAILYLCFRIRHFQYLASISSSQNLSAALLATARILP